MKPRRLMTRRLRCEALEGRLVLSVVPVLPTVAVLPAFGHNQSATEVAKSSVKATPIASDSSNWSGYAVTGSSVSDVVGSWVVPTVNPKTNGYSAVWVGIDGYSSSTVEQLGTGEDVANGKATYYAWYEMYPSASMTVSTMTVKPGTRLPHQSPIPATMTSC